MDFGHWLFTIAFVHGAAQRIARVDRALDRFDTTRHANGSITTTATATAIAKVMGTAKAMVAALAA
ncbi:MAG: hypothetical protein K2Q32_03995, partial [Alphaproteobacteria bacterium]|nr:hypothetical protein [Alphaproteobacteria bacterium]